VYLNHTATKHEIPDANYTVLNANYTVLKNAVTVTGLFILILNQIGSPPLA
jgi:hypothetical protein